MAILLDTSILVRLANSADAAHLLTTQAISELHLRGEALQIAPQNLIEFWNVATRPITANGLGRDIAVADALCARFENSFGLLDDRPGIFQVWKGIVVSQGVIGKQVHDARLVAVCIVHQVTQLLTFNTNHFARFAASAPGLTVLHPAAI
jgi:predicted nucleic acid-binding protein